MPQKILVVDDEPAICSLIKRFLENSFEVITAPNAKEAIWLAKECSPDLLLIDAQMPGMDGHALCRKFKDDPATAKVPVIMMSGVHMEEKDVVSGLKGGADDYLLKPLSFLLLETKIRTVLRRYLSEEKPEKPLKHKGLVVDPSSRTVKSDGKEIKFTRKEFDLLATLMEKSGRVLSGAYLLDHVWGYDTASYNDPHTVEVHISRIRQKLGKAAKAIVSVTGYGYKFDSER